MPLGVQSVTVPEEVQVISTESSAEDINGYFRVAFMGHLTEPIPYSASDEDVEKALEGLDTIDDVTVTKTSNYQVSEPPTVRFGSSWTVTFTPSQGVSVDLPMLLVSTDDGTTRDVTVCGGTLTGTEACVRTKESVKATLPTSYTISVGAHAKAFYARVSAENDNGQGFVGIAPITATPALKSPGAPRDASVSVVSSTEVGISWIAPLSSGGSAVSKYTVQLDTSLDFDASTIAHTFDVASLSGDGTASSPYRVVISSLSSSSNYYVRVIAYSSAGYGEPVYASPSEDAREVQAIYVRADSALTSGEITISLGGLSATPVQYDASAEDMRSALQSISTLEYMPLTVSRHTLTDAVDLSGVDTIPYGYVWVVTFTQIAGDVAELAAAETGAFSGGWTGSGSQLEVVTIRDGAGLGAVTITPGNRAVSALDDAHTCEQHRIRRFMEGTSTQRRIVRDQVYSRVGSCLRLSFVQHARFESVSFALL